MTTARALRPLAASALELLGEGATADILATRFADTGATLAPDLADALLDDLLALGLARVARTVDGDRHVVPTSLGLKARAQGLSGDPALGLADLETLRTDLLSTIAHELRTPLTAIRTSAGVLADPAMTPTDDQRRRLLTAIERNAERMQRIVGDILDLSRFRSGSIRLQLRRFDACELASSVIASVMPLAEARSQRLLLAGCGGEFPEIPVYGDHRRLEQALLNLVSNAQHFSPDGADVSVTVSAGDDGQVRWTVVDRGPGIPQQDQERLFERFFVGRNDVQGARDGIGLGLPTALAIAQAHDGGIDVDSEVGRGSAFTLRVPADGPEDAEP
jgi:signal transduction histidine kinase